MQRITRSKQRASMAEVPHLFVLAGTNGAGKSSVGGAFLRESGGQYFNPDEITREILSANPSLGLAKANEQAWQLGVRILEKAIVEGRSHAFETTLGGNTVPALIVRAVTAGHQLHLWYAGLDSVDRHLARIAARVAHGGHDIPAEKVRERYQSSMRNLIALLPLATKISVYDNSAEQDPESAAPNLMLVLGVSEGIVHFPAQLNQLHCTPNWAKALVVRAFEVFTSALLARADV